MLSLSTPACLACAEMRYSSVHSQDRRNATCSAVQRVVIMGTGSFALEAMEAAGRNNAKHITLVSRPRKR